MHLITHKTRFIVQKSSTLTSTRSNGLSRTTWRAKFLQDDEVIRLVSIWHWLSIFIFYRLRSSIITTMQRCCGMSRRVLKWSQRARKTFTLAKSAYIIVQIITLCSSRAWKLHHIKSVKWEFIINMSNSESVAVSVWNWNQVSAWLCRSLNGHWIEWIESAGWKDRWMHAILPFSYDDVEYFLTRVLLSLFFLCTL